MRVVYTRQAKSFLKEDESLYRRGPAILMETYAERMTHAIRIAPYESRKAALNMASDHMLTAWAQIHRALRPYFFNDLDAVIGRTQQEPMELPDFTPNENIHIGMHFCIDVLEDLDRLTLFAQESGSEENAEVIFQCWNSVFRATRNHDGVARRIKSGKAFKGNQ